MKAMVLAAGLGERLAPLTRSVPKPMVPVLGAPMIALVLQRLAASGVDDAVVNLFHHSDRIRSLLGDGVEHGLPRLHYSTEPRLLGTAGGIGRAADSLRGDGPVLVHNGDCLSDLDIAALLEAHVATGRAVTLALCAGKAGYSPIEIDDDRRIVRIGGRSEGRGAPGTWLFTGCHVFDEEVLERIPDRPSDIVRDVYLPLMNEGAVGAYLHDGFWWEFGDPSKYLAGSLRLLDLDDDARERIGAFDPVSRAAGATVALGTGAEIPDAAVLLGRVALGMASHVADGCIIEDSVILPEAWIGPASSVRRSIVAAGAELPAGAEFDSVMVCPAGADDEPLPPGIEKKHGLLVRPLERSG